MFKTSVKKFVFVWTEGEYLWIMKTNCVERVGLEFKLQIKKFVFVWKEGEYLWIMKTNCVERVGLEKVANFRVRA